MKEEMKAKLGPATAEERSFLDDLDKILRSKEVRAQIQPIVERVRADLAQEQKAVMAWEPIPLTTYGDALTAGIPPTRGFVLRAGAHTGAERPPNNHQRISPF